MVNIIARIMIIFLLISNFMISSFDVVVVVILIMSFLSFLSVIMGFLRAVPGDDDWKTRHVSAHGPSVRPAMLTGFQKELNSRCAKPCPNSQVAVGECPKHHTSPVVHFLLLGMGLRH